MNPWHDVEYGENAPGEVNAVIEVPKNSVLKYELDKKTGMLRLDRILYHTTHFLGNYGFIPKTYWDDDDPLDILVLGDFPLEPLTIVNVRVIGVLHMFDNHENDDKIIAVHPTDPQFGKYQDINDIPKHLSEEIRHFFETYKKMNNIPVAVLSMHPKEEAMRLIEKSIANYKKRFRRKSRK